MHGDWSSAEFAGDVGRVCAFGGVAAAARVVSSALVSCEIPPRPGGKEDGAPYSTGDVAAPVAVLSASGADDVRPGSSEGFEGHETNDGTGPVLGVSSSSYSNHSLVAGASLWVEYLADGAGVADGFPD